MKYVDLKSEFKGLTQCEKFKLYRELWQDAANFKIITSHPLHLDIELSSICNLKCDFCFQNGMLTPPLGLMDIRLFKRIIDQGVKEGLCAIKLQIRGESLLHPQFFECVDYAKQKGVLDVQVTTNGTLLNNETIQRILFSRLDAIILSIDSHHADSLAKKNKTTSYSSTEEKIKHLLNEREKFDKQKPWIRLQSSIPNEDFNSHQAAKSYLQKNFPKADIYVVSRIFDFRYNHDAYPDLCENYDLLPCPYLMQRLAVFWNGDVTVCCSDYNNRFQLGKFPDQTIQAIWHSKKLQIFRKCHQTGQRERMDICRHCQAALNLKTDKNNIILDKTKCHMSDYCENLQP